jgi:hypothetical protein
VVGCVTVAIERKCDLDRRPFALRAPYGDRAAQNLDAVAQSDEAAGDAPPSRRVVDGKIS